ncbi:MAG: hypothetical protein ABGX16_06960 [Pirellulales bacterium]
MSNHSPRVPKYRHHKPTGQAVVTLDGRDYYLGKYRSAASQEAYQRLTAEWLTNGGRMARQAEEITVVELIVAYLNFANGYYLKDGEPTSEIKTTKRALKVVRELYGRELVSKFGPLALKAVRQRMIEIGWVRTQINKNVVRIRRVFKWGESEEIVPRGVYETLRTVSGLRKGRGVRAGSAGVRGCRGSDSRKIVAYSPGYGFAPKVLRSPAGRNLQSSTG